LYLLDLRALPGQGSGGVHQHLPAGASPGYRVLQHAFRPRCLFADPRRARPQLGLRRLPLNSGPPLFGGRTRTFDLQAICNDLHECIARPAAIMADTPSNHFGRAPRHAAAGGADHADRAGQHGDGAADVAAHTLTLRLAGVAYAVPAALLQAAMVRMARAEAQADSDLNRQVIRSALWLGTFAGTLLCLGLLAGATPLSEAF